MKATGHLLLQREVLSPSEERELAPCGWQFLQLEEGWAYWLWQHTAVEWHPGDLLVLLPHNRGHLRASQIGRVRFHTFHFCPELVTGLMTLQERRRLRELAGASRPQPRILPASQACARQFHRMAREASKASGLLSRCRMLELAITVIAEEILETPLPLERGDSAGARFRQLASQMTDSEWSLCTVEDLARLCGCGVRHFRHLFRQQFGASMHVSRRNGRLVVPLEAPQCAPVKDPDSPPEHRRQAGSPASSPESNPAAIPPSPAVPNFPSRDMTATHTTTQD
ncbi:MAG: helix-turn-helix transcriptional regulator [Verrucomicrobia bacterium]|nr:helix-turn-helix transcriptional regulator [Verrucomicrobiota bacterium]